MLTYDETRLWVTWARVFTRSDLADTMGVVPEAIDGFIVGLQYNGTIADTGDRVNGTEAGEEAIWSYIPLPPGPTHHPHKTPPEIVAAHQLGMEIFNARGLPVRIRTERDQRKTMSTPGARGRIKRREQRYRQMQEAVEERRLKQLARQQNGQKPTKTKRRIRREENKEWWE